MPNNEDKSLGAIDELRRPSERAIGAELIVWIDDFRARQLLPQAQEKLQVILTEIAMSILAEGRRIASADGHGTDAPFSPMSAGHIASGLIAVIEKSSLRVANRRKVQLLIETLAAAFFGSSISLTVEKHFYSALSCTVVSSIVYYILYIRNQPD